MLSGVAAPQAQEDSSPLGRAGGPGPWAGSPAFLALEDVTALPCWKARPLNSAGVVAAQAQMLLSHARLRIADHRAESLLEALHQFLMGGVDFRVGQRSLGISVGERVGHALVPGRNVLAPEHVE